eukprot:gene29350-38429_t
MSSTSNFNFGIDNPASAGRPGREGEHRGWDRDRSPNITHYVLYITLVGDPSVALKFKLNVKVRSLPKANNVSEPEDDEDIEERFGNASLEEAVTDDNGNAV